jgi:hypothetical protein
MYRRRRNRSNGVQHRAIASPRRDLFPRPLNSDKLRRSGIATISRCREFRGLSRSSATASREIASRWLVTRPILRDSTHPCACLPPPVAKFASRTCPGPGGARAGDLQFIWNDVLLRRDPAALSGKKTTPPRWTVD